MKRITFFALTFFLLITLTSCKNENRNNNEIQNPLLGKIYAINTIPNTFEFDYIKFYNDNTFQGIYVSYYNSYTTNKRTASYKNFYGTYKIDKNALEINMSNESYSGVIIDSGERIMFGEIEFYVPVDNFSDEFHLQLKE